MLSRIKAFTRENLSWLIIACIFFMFGYFLTYYTLGRYPEAMSQLITPQMEKLSELGQEIYTSHPLQGIYHMFSNNAIASFGIILFSFFLGLPPLFSLVGNGALIGAVSFILAEQNISFLPFFIYGILPHGIFELPAFIFSAALGLKIGYHVLFPLPGEGRINSMKILYREVLRMTPVIVILLVIAACVEVLVTPLILDFFLPTDFTLN